MSEQNKTEDNIKKKNTKDDILSIVKQFVSYFEEVDRSNKDGHSIKRS